jgi:hypothetical protein
MNFDNQIFNVNGRGTEGLTLALTLAFLQDGFSKGAEAYKISKEHGLVFYWTDTVGIALDKPMQADELVDMVERYLSSDEAKECVLSDFCDNVKHDGHNSKGWQVYKNNWGFVGDSKDREYALCGIKPAYIWHGK